MRLDARAVNAFHSEMVNRGVDHEELGRAVRDYAGLKPNEVLSSLKIIRRLPGIKLRRVPIQSALAMCTPFGDGHIITIHPNAADVNWLGGHELGHWAMRVLAKRPVHTEDDANRIAAAILAPAQVVRQLHDAFGEQVGPIAKALDLSQTSVVLRIGVVRGEERAVVAPTHVRAISYGGFASRPEPVLREYVQATPKGLKKARLGGWYDRGRIALRATA